MYISQIRKVPLSHGRAHIVFFKNQTHSSFQSIAFKQSSICLRTHVYTSMRV